METNEPSRFRESLKRRAWELLSRELPSGWECSIAGEGIRLIHHVDDEKKVERHVSLDSLYARVEEHPEQRREALYAMVNRILAGIEGYTADRQLRGQEAAIYPVLRHHSFLNSTEEPVYVAKPHTSETVIVYALDHRILHAEESRLDR